MNSVVKLYGDINYWNHNNAVDVANRIEVAAKMGDLVEFHVHSYGGSVSEGNLIINAIKHCKKPIHAYIDGVAASQAAIVIMSCDKIFMSENAILMLHAPAGVTSGRGTAKEHEDVKRLLAGIEKSFVKTLMAKTGKDEASVKKWMDGDNWFSAEDALREGLIDAIVDPIATNVPVQTVESITTFKVEDIYGQYTAHLGEIEKPNNNNQMNKEQLIQMLGLTGVTAQSSDAEIEAAILAKQKSDKEALEAAQNALTAQASAQITAAIDQHKDKITVEQRAHFQSIGEKCGIEALKSALAPYAQHKSITEQISATAQSAPQATATWNFEDWQKNDPAGLEKMSKENYDAFNALYKARFGANAPK